MPRLSEAVKNDHAVVRRAYRRLAAERAKPDQFIWALDRYLIVDELIVVPALEYGESHGGPSFRRLSDDYDSITAKLRHMQNYDPQDPSFESALKAIWVDLEPHFREESELAALEEALSPSESETLGKKYENVKELLQKPYGPDGVPDERTLSAILDMSLQDLMVKLGVRWE